jgi:hypothetical protein
VPTVPAGFTLVPGEAPVDLPITVLNSGETASEPVSAALDLPPGVRSVGSAASFAGNRLVGFDGAEDQNVTCPAGTGTVTCTTSQGIAPGGQATFVFRIQADPDASNGRITGTLSAGVSLSVSIEVAVEVRPVHDDLELLVDKWQHGFWDPRLDIRATNTGGRAGTLRLVVESDDHVTLVAFGCKEPGRRVVCEVPLDRNKTFRLAVWALGSPHRNAVVRVSATLGDAAKSVDVPLTSHPHWGDGQVPEPPVERPTVTPGTSTTTPGPTTTTPKPTTTQPPTTQPPTTTEPSTTDPTTTAPTTPPAQTPTPTPDPTTTEPTTPAPTPTPTEPTTPTHPGQGDPCRPGHQPTPESARPDRCRTPS